MNFKSEITKLHYTKESKGLIFELLRFCSFFYGLGSGAKNFLYDKGFLKPKKVDAFVISVGNFTTGGVGKTPVVAEIAKYFIENPGICPPCGGSAPQERRGVNVAIISRGYGGKLDNKNVNVISDGINLYHKADMAGDEPYWLAVNLNMCAVLTCSNRVKAAEYAIKELGVNTIILDDGFQHRKMARDLDIVLVDSEKMFGNENLLPAGPLREKPDFGRVDKLVIVSKNLDHSKAEELIQSKDFCPPCGGNVAERQRGVFIAKVQPDYAYNIITGEHLEKGAEITVLSAIGQPEQFYQFLEPDFKVKEKITFDDHHQYVLDDIKNIEGNIVTTEKDAVKLSLLGRENIYALKLKTVIDVEKLCYNN